LLEVGRREEAEPLLRHAHERILAVLGPDHPRVAEVEGLLAKAAR
jgi:hypothetical protein